MKITVYSSKGSAGKTPIATNIVLGCGYAIATNEKFHVFDSFIDDDKLLSVDMEDEFPDIPGDIDIVFDLAGSISSHSKSITSAIRQSDVVIVPIYNEIKCLAAGINCISEVASMNTNVIVVATKLQKQPKEIFSDWRDSKDFLNIQSAVNENIDFDIDVLPLKFSKVFDAIFEKEMSIEQLMKVDALARYHYAEVSRQFNDIYKRVGVE